MTKQQRAELREMFGGHCAYCGCELPANGWHADHIEAVRRDWEFVRDEHGDYVTRPNGTAVTRSTGVLRRPENERDGNYFPACRACNIDKRDSSLEGWRQQMQDRVAVCRRNYSAFRHAERFGLVQEIIKPVVFYFERRKQV